MSLRLAIALCTLSAISTVSCHHQLKTAETSQSENVPLQSHVPPDCYRFDVRLGGAGVVSSPPRDDSKSVYRFSFTSASPWNVAEGSAHCEIADGVLAIKTETAASCDSPAMVGASPQGIGAILIQARVSGCSKFTFAWRGENADFLKENEASVDAAKSDDWVLYQLNTDKFRGWNSDLGNVGQVRLILPENTSIEIRSMDFVRSIDPFAGKSYGQMDYAPGKRKWLHSVFARTPCSLEYDVTVMPNARLTAGFLIPAPVPTQFRVLLVDGTERYVLAEKQMDTQNSMQEVAVDLSQWAGKNVKIRFEAESQQPGSVALWCNPALERVYPVTEANRPLNAVWYVIDCLRAMNVSSYGHERETTPTLDAVASEGARFEWCFSPGTWTVDSVSSFFTGLSPNAHGMMRTRFSIPESMHMLSEDLRTAGYATALFSTNPYMEKRLGFIRGFDEAYRFRVRGLANRKNATADNYPTNVAIGKFLEKNKENPFFIYIHTIEAHGPYVPPASLRVFAHPDGSVKQTDLYDDCILWADMNLEYVIGKLKAEGLWNNTLLIVSADHGQCIPEYDNGLDGHGKEPYLSRVRIPLVMRLPGIIPKGVVINENVQELDVPPTLFELLHIEPDPQFGGWSLLGVLNGSRKSEFAQRMLFPSGQNRKWQAVVDGKWYFHDNDGKLELYDLASDPTAKKDVSAEYNDIAQTMLSESRKYREAELEKGKTYPAESDVAEISEEVKEELRALGYME